MAAHQTQEPALVMPSAGAGRSPAAIVLGSNAALVDSLHADGIATLTAAADLAEASAAISRLRNDPRVITVTIIGPGGIAAPAARTARADAFVSTAGVAPDINSRVIASLVSADAHAIAAFIRGLTPVRHPATQRASLRDTAVADLAGARITIEYGRPSKRGRAIWGALVPWGRWWMPGADEATVITNAAAIQIGTLNVPAGEHTLYALPADTDFTLIVNNDVGQFHTEYRPDHDLGRVVMTKSPVTELVERMTYGLASVPGGLTLKLTWDDRQYAVPVTLR